MTRLSSELLRANAYAHAAAGAWTGLRELLVEHEELASLDAELATLRAESELRTGRPRSALEWLTRILRMLERSGDRRSLRTALNLRGVAELELGALDEAELTFTKLLELARNDADELLSARVLNNLGALADMRDRFDEALATYERALPSYQRLGDVRGLAETQHNVAISLRHMGQLEHAEDRERQAIGYASEARDPMLESLARLGLGELALEKGDAALAEAIARHAAKRFAADGNALREADALRVVGAACLAQQKLRDARDVLRRALELAVANGARLLEAEIRRLNVELLLTSGHREAAATEAHEAARLFEKLGSPSKAQECRNRLL